MNVREFFSMLSDVLFTPRRAHCRYCGGRHCVGACGVHTNREAGQSAGAENVPANSANGESGPGKSPTSPAGPSSGPSSGPPSGQAE